MSTFVKSISTAASQFEKAKYEVSTRLGVERIAGYDFFIEWIDPTPVST